MSVSVTILGFHCREDYLWETSCSSSCAVDKGKGVAVFLSLLIDSSSDSYILGILVIRCCILFRYAKYGRRYHRKLFIHGVSTAVRSNLFLEYVRNMSLVSQFFCSEMGAVLSEVYRTLTVIVKWLGKSPTWNVSRRKSCHFHGKVQNKPEVSFHHDIFFLFTE